MKVLVAYGSQFGSTAQVAERIAQVLRQEGHDSTWPRSTRHPIRDLRCRGRG